MEFVTILSIMLLLVLIFAASRPVRGEEFFPEVLPLPERLTTNIFNDPLYYDLTKLFHNPSNTDVTDYKLQKLQYTSLRGTLPQPEPRSIAGISGEPNCSIETCSDAQRVVPGILGIADAPTLMAKRASGASTSTCGK